MPEEVSLLVRDGITDRPLNTDDLASETTLLEVLAALTNLTIPSTRTVIAGMDLSGHRLVVPEIDDRVVYADSTTLDDISAPVWITTGAIMEDEAGTVVYLGSVIEGGWTWTPAEPVYLGANGVLTQVTPTVPTYAFLLQVGLAINATELFYNPKSPIVLS